VGPQDEDPVCHDYSASWFHYKVSDDHKGLSPQGNLCNTCARTMDASYPCYTVNELAQAKSLGWNVYVSRLRFVVIRLRFVVIRWTALAPWTVSTLAV
jgi:hypothetical protein